MMTMIPINAVPYCKDEVLIVVGSVAAGHGLNVECSETENVKCPYTSPEYVALRVVGDSMYPKIEDGDIVIVHRQEDVKNGEIAAILINGDRKRPSRPSASSPTELFLTPLTRRSFPPGFIPMKKS